MSLKAAASLPLTLRLTGKTVIGDKLVLREKGLLHEEAEKVLDEGPLWLYTKD